MTPRLVAAAIVLWAFRAEAAGPPPAEVQGAQKQAPATSGSTEIAGQGQFATAAVPDEIESTDALEGDVFFGALLSTGNARSVAITGGSNFRIRRGAHQFGAGFAGNYARAAIDRNAPAEATVGNAQGRLRYDFFMHRRVSVFAMATARHDPFQQLQARVNLDPGFAFYVLTEPQNRLWAEVGYDFQYDRLTDEGRLVVDEMGMRTGDILPAERLTHAVRLAGNYVNNIHEKVSFRTGLEYLQSVLRAERWRINWDVALTANLFSRLAVSLTFTARMDNEPPAADVEQVDTITALSLLYRFF